ncbi:hypothetical protein PI124_g16660 [Phytophthora idaei]|nr:hypothetical protein PI125_g6248 [Phytophthora idaei]KAG3168743.1 hypothetical protein PI126_g3163 [Phytophthora idaei]KAG3238375.1 hypothetical protein PI124_g16660 [Phytophthora idaei]
MLKKGQVLKRYCTKRQSWAFINKAPACTKKALKQMTEYLYLTAATTDDYQDAELLCLLWFLFGRTSDLIMLRKANLSIGSGDIFFVRLIRMKTSEEHGQSQFPDEDFATYPLLAIALTLVSQASPTISLLSQLPERQSASQVALTPATPLIELIDIR